MGRINSPASNCKGVMDWVDETSKARRARVGEKLFLRIFFPDILSNSASVSRKWSLGRIRGIYRRRIYAQHRWKPGRGGTLRWRH